MSLSRRSIRYGSAEPIGKRSIKPPRTLNSPGDTTCVTCEYPASASCERSASTSSVSPCVRKNVNAARYDGGASRYSALVAATTSTSHSRRDTR